ncbi:MAG: GDSL-type esterase/lipase family protein [Saprospiraceae bacterium]
MLKYRIILFFALVVIAIGDINSQSTIVVLGSSTAAGTGPSHIDSSWVNRYTKYVKSLDEQNKVINLAKGGYTTFHILPSGTSTPNNRPNPDSNRNITKAISYYPDAIIINLPSNDAASEYSVSSQLENYNQVLQKANIANIPVWISTPQGRNLSYSGKQNLLEMRDSTIIRYGEQAIDFWTYIGQSNGSLNTLYSSGDGVHLNDKGHKILFNRVVEKNILDIISVVEDVKNDEFDIVVYPNPTNDYVYFDCNNKNVISSLIIFDSSGREVVNMKNVNHTKSHSIDLKHLNTGAFYVKLIVDGKIRFKKLMKVK